MNEIESLDGEEWRPVSDASFLQVSSMGRIKSCRGENGRMVPGEGWRLVTPKTDKDGYQKLTVNSKQVRVHTLVATVFLERPDSKFVVARLSRDKTDNSVTNLKWMSKADANRLSISLEDEERRKKG